VLSSRAKGRQEGLAHRQPFRISRLRLISCPREVPGSATRPMPMRGQAGCPTFVHSQLRCRPHHGPAGELGNCRSRRSPQSERQPEQTVCPWEFLTLRAPSKAAGCRGRVDVGQRYLALLRGDGGT